MINPKDYPAFPVYPRNEGYKSVEIKDAMGMTLRDYFAGQALMALAQDSGTFATFEETAKEAYRYADAMLAERAK